MEAELVILVGCDLHTRKQQVALLNTDTGELRDQELSHVGDDVERFYAALSPPVSVGIESTGYSLWFHALLQRLGHTLLVGEAAKIHAMRLAVLMTSVARSTTNAA
jgi:transposase